MRYLFLTLPEMLRVRLCRVRRREGEGGSRRGGEVWGAARRDRDRGFGRGAGGAHGIGWSLSGTLLRGLVSTGFAATYQTTRRNGSRSFLQTC